MSRKRPRLRERYLAIPAVDLPLLANDVRYVGSVEHKDARSEAGWPRPRADASICDRTISGDFLKLTRWLQRAIRDGDVGAPWEGRFPRYVWYRDGSVVYEGRLVNRDRGEYKGYPLDRREWPEFLR